MSKLGGFLFAFGLLTFAVAWLKWTVAHMAPGNSPTDFALAAIFFVCVAIYLRVVDR